MKKLLCVVAGICLVCFVAGSAIAGQPSAKFAATWSTPTEPQVVSVAVVSDTERDAIIIDLNEGYTLAKIKVPQDKEVMVGLSAEVGLVTDTSIKGKEGGTAKAIAVGKANVTIFAIPEPFNWEGIRKAEELGLGGGYSSGHKGKKEITSYFWIGIKDILDNDYKKYVKKENVLSTPSCGLWRKDKNLESP